MIYWCFAIALLLSLPARAPAWNLHIAAAYDVQEAPSFPRTFTRGLSTANRDLLRGLNLSLSLLPIPLGHPDNRSRTTVDEAVHELCGMLESRRVLMLLVIGSKPAAVAVALAAGATGLPVLWARNDTASQFFQQALSEYEIHLDPSMNELVSGIRSLLLSAHWHTFSLISDDTMDSAAIKSGLMKHSGAPTLESSYVIRVDGRSESVFHRLAELQRAARGVVLLAARPSVTQRILIEAQRLRMLNSDWVWIILDTNNLVSSIPKDLLPVGMLSLTPRNLQLYTKQTLKGVLRILVKVIRTAVTKNWLNSSLPQVKPTCWKHEHLQFNFAKRFAKALRGEVRGALSGATRDTELAPLAANFDLRNLVRKPISRKHHNNNTSGELIWKSVGNISGTKVSLDTIVWPGGEIVGPSPGGRSVFRVVTALAPPFVMEGLLEDGQCLRGVRCHRLPLSSAGINSRDNLTLLFSWEPEDEITEDNPLRPTCCYGFAMDLLENIAQELEFDFHLYLVNDGMYGAKKWNHKINEFVWNGIIGDLVSGAAHMSFAGLSVSSQRSEVVDFTSPFYYGGISILAAPAQKNEIPLLAFLLPFSPELWIAIFISLNMTAIAVAIYEWLSPFGLNPWGRQRSKNFSMASALWVMWGLLCGHLVAFKAPKSWPNKFLINVWGGFSVIFVASYTANIAALIAGHFFQNSPSYHDRSLLSQRVGIAKSTVAEFYVQQSNQVLYQHLQQYPLRSLEDGVERLRNGSLDMIIGDTAVLDYYRATDPGCNLHRFGDPLSQDMYAVAMNKGFPLKNSISALISKYSNNGYLDILQEKWYGGLPCFRLETEMVQPRPLGVDAVAGVFLLLGLGFFVGLLILLVEHIFYRQCLPGLRSKPKGTVWRSRNVMFFSQKLYRFINCVELVSPHHAARELVHTLRQGHITSLFQKSVKRKEHEQRRRRKSKAQFFQMIQEIRRVQAEERDQVTTSSVASPTSITDTHQANTDIIPMEEKRYPSIKKPSIRFQDDQNESESICRKRNNILKETSYSYVIPIPPPLPPLHPPPQPVINLLDKEQQWKKRETLLKQQLKDVEKERVELLDRIKILERCIKEPP